MSSQNIASLISHLKQGDPKLWTALSLLASKFDQQGQISLPNNIAGGAAFQNTLNTVSSAFDSKGNLQNLMLVEPYHSSAAGVQAVTQRSGSTASTVMQTVASFQLKFPSTLTKYSAPVSLSSVGGSGNPVGPKSPSTAQVLYANSWSTPYSNIFVNDSNFIFPEMGSALIAIQGFGFNLASNYNVVGIKAALYKSAASGHYQQDSEMQLIIDHPAFYNINYYPNYALGGYWAVAKTEYDYGSATDLWGRAAGIVTPALINSPNFGIEFSASVPDSLTYLYYASITVYYSYVTVSGQIKIGSATSNVLSGIQSAPSTVLTVQSPSNDQLVTVELQAAIQGGGTVTANLFQTQYTDQDPSHFV